MNIDVLELGAQGFYLLLVATWRALPLLLIAWLVGMLFRRRLAAKYHALLWGLVVIRLLLPISLPSTWSLQGSTDRLAEALFDSLAPSAESSAISYRVQDEWKDVGDPTATLLPEAVLEPAPPVSTWSWEEILFATLLGAWAIVAAGCLLRGLFAHIRFARRLHSCLEISDPDFINLMLQECDSLRVPRRPKVKAVPGLSAPAVFGLWRSTICLPPNICQQLSEQELRWVLRHELAHVRRRDSWWMALGSIAQALHWFNPLAWLTTSQLRSQIEAAADDLAMGFSSPKQSIAYGHLLLRFAEQSSSTTASPALGLLQFVSRHRLHRRIERLTHPRAPRRRLARWLTAIALCTVAVAGLSDAAEQAENSQSESHVPRINLPKVDLNAIHLDETDDEPRSLRKYDVAKVLQQILKSQPDANAELMLQSVCQMNSNQTAKVEGDLMTAEVSEGQHAAIVDLLEAWSTGGCQQIVVEMRIIHADLRFAAPIDWVSRGISELESRGPQPVIAARVTDAQLRRFIQTIQAEPRSNILFAPKVTLFNGQSATISDLVQRPFVTAISPHQNGGLQPVVQILDDGIQVTLHPVTSGDGSVTLSLDLRAAKIDKVAMANLPYRLPEDPTRNVTIQVPSVSNTSVRSKVKLGSTESLMIAAPQLFDKMDAKASNMSLFYVFTPRLIDRASSND